jgi:hypothetical protein
MVDNLSTFHRMWLVLYDMICMIGYDSVEDTCISDDYRCRIML